MISAIVPLLLEAALRALLAAAAVWAGLRVLHCICPRFSGARRLLLHRWRSPR